LVQLAPELVVTHSEPESGFWTKFSSEKAAYTVPWLVG
jgi:hypothetical protein